MSPACQFSFGPFRLDPSDAGLWRGAQALALTPKAFAVLQYLLAHAGELAPKEAFFASVWHDAVVSDGALKVCIDGDPPGAARRCAHPAVHQDRAPPGLPLHLSGPDAAVKDP